MNQIDLANFAVGGATRPDSFTGLDPEFMAALQAMIGGAPPEIQPHLRITSGYRSPEKQAELWEGALAKYGSPEIARKWVAPPGKSHHNKGGAVDFKYGNDAARTWAHENAGNFGLHFPLSNEDWHVEMMGSRGGAAPSSPSPMAGMLGMGGQEVGATKTEAPQQMGLGDVFSAMAPQPQPMQPAPQAVVQTSDPLAAAGAALQGSQKAKGLQMALAPDVERLMGLSRRS